MSAHLNVKNHVCGLCGKSFFRKEYLTGHLIQHGGAVAEGLSGRKRASTFKPRPSVFNQTPTVIKRKRSSLEDLVADREEEVCAEIVYFGPITVFFFTTFHDIYCTPHKYSFGVST